MCGRGAESHHAAACTRERALMNGQLSRIHGGADVYARMRTHASGCALIALVAPRGRPCAPWQPKPGTDNMAPAFER
eukprot:5728753-Prymnesium_polylepis.1